jgi:lipoprotein-anchoring transpeptidase ErfK/SrfK
MALLFFCSGCAELESDFNAQGVMLSDAVRTALAAPFPTHAYWHPGPFRGASKIVVHLHEQRAFFYKGKHLVGETNISTGRRGFDTPPGRYSVIQKDADHYSSLYGDYVNGEGEVVVRNVDVNRSRRPHGTHFKGAAMPYFLRFTEGYGMHAGFVPRYRASHGCIRMPREMARHFYNAAEIGTPVIVRD